MRHFVFRTLFVFAGGFCGATTATVLPEVLVTEDSAVSLSIITIDREQIERRGTQNLAEILSQEVGVQTVTAGGSGQPTFVFLRGAASEHTLVLIDGIQVNDAGSTSRTFDFSTMSLENVEKIEIFKGARGVRFGSDAIGGVINIITKKGEGPLNSKLLASLGSFKTWNLGGQASGGSGKFHYSLGLSQMASQSFSASAGSSTEEKDGMKQMNMSSKIGWTLSENAQLQFTGRNSVGKNELDYSGGPLGDDPNYQSLSDQSYFGGTLTVEGASNRWASRTGVYQSLMDRTYSNLSDSNHTESYFERFKSNGLKLETWQEFAFDKYSRVELGLQQRTEKAGVREQNIFGQALLYSLRTSNFSGELGARHDKATSSEVSIISKSLTLGYAFPTHNLSFEGNFGDGFKTPSLFQLFSQFGDSRLEAERSKSWDVGVEKRLFKNTHFSLSYFENHFENLIDFNIVNSKYQNINSAFTSGLEFALSQQLNHFLTWKFSTQSLHTKNNATNQSLLRRAPLQFNGELNFEMSPLEIQMAYKWSGQKEDIDPQSYSRFYQRSYDVLSITGQYEWNEDINIFWRAENLMNTTYQEVAGYSTSPRAIYLGSIFKLN